MNTNKPLVSLIIPFYNQENYVEDAVKGALSQTYDNLEIVLSDDCSSDGTFDRIIAFTKNYKGPHKILINRNEHNLGLVSHVNKILYELSHGDFIFVNGGDDSSLPNRVAEGMQYFINDNSVSALTSALIYIDDNGAEFDRMHLDKDIRYSLSDKNYLLSQSFMCGQGMLAIRRDVLNFFGPLNNDCQTEDSCLRFRSLLVGDVVASANYGVKYRIHGRNMSLGNAVYKLKTHLIANQYRKDLEVAKEIIAPSLYLILMKKISYYKINRETSAVLATSSSWINIIVYRIVRKIENLIYERKIRNFFLSNIK